MSGIRITYTELFSVTIVLPFYANGRSRRGAAAAQPDIFITPDTETLALFRRMDLILREVPGGAIVLARTLRDGDAAVPKMRFPARPGDKITLRLGLNNPDLLAVHDLPPELGISKLLYLSNRLPDPDAARTALPLSESASGISGDSDTIAFSGAVYRYRHNGPDPQNALVSQKLSGRSIGPASAITENGKTRLSFDLSDLPAGVCELHIGDARKDRFYHLPAHGESRVFGVIEISPDAALDAIYRVIEADRSLTPERPRYVARFQSRDTFWRYTFSMQPSGALARELDALSPAQRAVFIDNLNIVSNDSSISFAPGESAAANELVFVSSTPTALREAYYSQGGAALSLALHKNIGDAATEAVLKRGLPYPSPRLIAAGDAGLYSDIFITI